MINEYVNFSALLGILECVLATTTTYHSHIPVSQCQHSIHKDIGSHRDCLAYSSRSHCYTQDVDHEMTLLTLEKAQRERERQRETETETERETDRQTDREEVRERVKVHIVNTTFIMCILDTLVCF